MGGLLSRGIPRFGDEAFLPVPALESLRPLAKAFAAMWSAPDNTNELETALLWIAQLYCRSKKQLELAPRRADVTATLASFGTAIKTFRSDWRSVRDETLSVSIGPMPCGPGNTYCAWLWLGKATSRIATSAWWCFRHRPELSLHKRKKYLKLASSARSVSAAISSINFVAEKEIVYRLPLSLEGDVAPHRSLLDFTSFMLDSTKAAWRDSKGRRGPDVRHEIRIAAHALANCYERFVGARFTHSPYVDTSYVYTSKPQTKGGIFVHAFLKAVDPDIRDASINTALSRVVREKQTKPISS